MRKRRIFGYSFVRQIVRRQSAIRLSLVLAANYTFSCSRPRSTHKRSLSVVRVSRIPLCWIDSCDYLISSWTNSWLAGNRTGFLEFTGNGELLNRPLHLITPSCRYNPNCVTYIGGFDLWSLRWRNSISLVNDDACTDVIQRCSASFKSVAFKLISSFFVLSFRTQFLNLFANLRTRAVTQSRFVKLWKRFMSIIWSILFSGVSSELFTSKCVRTGGFFTASSRTTLSSDCVDWFTGHSNFGVVKECCAIPPSSVSGKFFSRQTTRKYIRRIHFPRAMSPIIHGGQISNFFHTMLNVLFPHYFVFYPTECSHRVSPLIVFNCFPAELNLWTRTRREELLPITPSRELTASLKVRLCT